MNTIVTSGVSVVSHAASLVGATINAIKDPEQGDMVAAVGELTQGNALDAMMTRMMQDRQGRRIIRLQPRVTDNILEKANTMSEGTFGRAYADYMNANGFLPSGRTEVKYIPDPRHAYIMTRYRETHDFLHAVVGCHRNVNDEVALKMFEFAQTGLPLGALAVAGGLPHLNHQQATRLLSVYRKWAAANTPTDDGRVKFFMNVMWEDLLDQKHDDVLRMTGFTHFSDAMKVSV